MDGTWACKKKSNGVFRARLNLRGYKQVDGVHFDSHNVSAPVASVITIHHLVADHDCGMARRIGQRTRSVLARRLGE